MANSDYLKQWKDSFDPNIFPKKLSHEVLETPKAEIIEQYHGKHFLFSIYPERGIESHSMFSHLDEILFRK